MGIYHFDSWAANFGEVTTALELTVEGSGFRFKSRFNKFTNLPELMNIFREVADVQTADMLDLDVPALRGGKPIIVESEPDWYVKQVMEDFVVRAERIRGGGVDPSVDNFLKITHEARLLGTDARAKEGSNIKGFATVVFGDSFKITNIAILENKDKGELFVSMPRYRSNERDESNGVIYKDVCNPITAEFREELYTNILDAYARIKEPEKEETQKQDRTQEMPEFSVTVTPYERKGSNIKGLARIYFENSFIVNNINIVQGKEKIFVSMPSYKTKQVDEQGKI